MTRQEKIEEIAEKAELNVEETNSRHLLPPPRSSSSFYDFDSATTAELAQPKSEADDDATSSFNERAKNFARNCAAESSTTVWLRSRCVKRIFLSSSWLGPRASKRWGST